MLYFDVSASVGEDRPTLNKERGRPLGLGGDRGEINQFFRRGYTPSFQQ
jgi:hypothetical protein